MIHGAINYNNILLFTEKYIKFGLLIILFF